MRILRNVLLAVVAAGAVLAAIVAFVLARSVAPRSGREPLPGLSDTVTVVFDSLAIPHITAAADLDAFAALGYLHARERLWQMEFIRRAAEGRLAEVLGPAAVASDRFLRSLDIPLAAERSLALLPPETRAVLDAYVRGVNRWIVGRPRPLPPEFQVLRFTPEPWTARRSLEVARLMAWDLVNADFELSLAREAAKVGSVRVRDLVPSYPDDAPVILPDGAGHWDTLAADRAALRRAARPRESAGGAAAGASGSAARAAVPSALLAAADVPAIPPLAAWILDAAAMSRASNSWVLGPTRSRSGKPILANDPHLTLRAPSLWYLAGISSPGYRVVGATIPGLPAVILGHNARIAWGLTNVGVDDVDFVIARITDDSANVLTPTGWVPTDVVRDSIHVRGRPAVPFTLVRTPHGPLVDRAVPARDPHTAVAMRWTAHDPSDELTAILAVNRASDWAGFSQALRGFLVPEQNWIYADVDGNIGYRMAGRVPVRRGGDGALPTPGWTDEGRWERYLSFEELPWALNPPEGFIVTANNRVAGPAYPHLITQNGELPWRAARIREMVQAGGPFTADDVRRMQMDTVDLFVRWAKEPAARAAEAAGRPDLARMLRAWDGTAGADRVEPSLFYAWYRALQRLTLEDETGGIAVSAVLQRWMRAGESLWFDDVRTAEREDFAAIAARAMREAIPQAEGIKWGRLHRTLSAHALGEVPLLARLLGLNIGPAPRAGSPYTVNVASFGARPPFLNTFAASFRHVVDLADIDRAGMILTTGESGNPVSRHYRDQVARWWNGELWTVPLALSEEAGASTLRLTPAR
jgi:penicillin amidase